MNLGRNPYGFIGDLQALKTTWDKAASRIAKLLLRHDKAMFEYFVQAMRDCITFDGGNELAEMLPALHSLEGDQLQELVDAYNDNSQIYESYGFNGSKPSMYGDGLMGVLERLAPGGYEIGSRSPYTIRRKAKRAKKKAS